MGLGMPMKRAGKGFYSIFVGQYVFVLTDLVITQLEEHGEQMLENQTPIKLVAYLIDMDDEWMYFGETPDDITQAFKAESIKHVEIALTPEDQALDDFPVPIDRSGVN